MEQSGVIIGAIEMPACRPQQTPTALNLAGEQWAGILEMKEETGGCLCD